MKKAICFTLCLLTFFFISGCNSMNFSKKSTETGTYVNDEVSLEIKNDSIDNSGLVLLISNKTNTDLTYDSTYYIEQKKNGVWYSSDNEQYFNAKRYCWNQRLRMNLKCILRLLFRKGNIE